MNLHVLQKYMYALCVCVCGGGGVWGNPFPKKWQYNPNLLDSTIIVHV